MVYGPNRRHGTERKGKERDEKKRNSIIIIFLSVLCHLFVQLCTQWGTNSITLLEPREITIYPMTAFR